jgi:hypothetical protein
MTKVEKLIREARQLPETDRARLLDEVERSLDADTTATRSDPRSYASLISIAGSAPSDFSDVSTEKYRHLAEAYAPKPGGK